MQQVLKESALVEAFNLKAAIEYNMKNFESAREAMADAPPRTEEELDPVSTAHCISASVLVHLTHNFWCVTRLPVKLALKGVIFSFLRITLWAPHKVCAEQHTGLDWMFTG